MTKKLFKSFLIVLAHLIFFNDCFAQKLAKASQESFLTFVYQISKEQAKSIYSEKNFKFPDAYFKYKIDSFPTLNITASKYLSDIHGPGFYLLVNTENNWLSIETVFISNIRVDLLDNDRDLILHIHQKDEVKPIENAQVKLAGKEIEYNQEFQTYVKPKNTKTGLLEIETENEYLVYNFERQGYDYHMSTFKRIMYKTLFCKPVRYVYYKGRSFTYRLFHYRGYRFSRTRKPKLYNGYLTVNQPKYLPGDTLKWKAYVLNKRAKPVNKEMELIIIPGWRDEFSIKQIVMPIGDGIYHGEVVLNDKLSLDLNYDISLNTIDKRNQKVVKSSFYYEDYELDELQFEMRLDKDEYNMSEPIFIYFSAKDQNDLNILDGKVELEILTGAIYDVYADSSFIPNLLWEHSFQLDPLGETKIQIPDSLLPWANMNVTVYAKFLNSNNEEHIESEKIRLSGIKNWIDANLECDNLFATFFKNGNESTENGTVIAMNESDTLSKKIVSFPIRLEVNPNATEYVIGSEQKEEWETISMNDAEFYCAGRRTKDSVFFNFYNPCNIQIHYTIFKGKDEIIEQKTGTNLNFRINDNSKDNYTISCNYIWGGKAQSRDYYAINYDKNLTVKIDQPAKVYPGQNADVTIKVTDHLEKPVSNVNLTANAINTQFDNTTTPALPYYGKHKVRYANYVNFELENASFSDRDILNDEWKGEFGLDSMLYYQHLYPKNGMLLYYDSSMKINNAQFAPHLYNSRGFDVDIYFVYIDYKMVYSYNTDAEPIYSFVAAPGYHKVMIRTRNKILKMDSVLFIENAKLDLSLNMSDLPPTVHVEEVKDKLSTDEVRTMENNTMYMKCDSRYYSTLLSQTSLSFYNYNRHANYNDYVKLAPLNYGNVHVEKKDKFTTDFRYESNYKYEVEEGLVKMVWDKVEIKKKKLPYLYSKKPIGAVSFDHFEEKKILKISLNDFKIDFNNYTFTANGNGTMGFEYNGDSLFYRLRLSRFDSDSGDAIYNGDRRVLYNLKPGIYRMVLQTFGGIFWMLDSIVVKADGYNFKRVNDQDFNEVGKTFFKIDKGEYIHDQGSSYSTYKNDRNYTARVKGKIVDAYTGEGVPFANVVIYDNDELIGASTTDIDGNYSIGLNKYGNFTLKTSYVGYSDVTLNNILISKDKTTYLGDLKLQAGEELHLVELVYASDGISDRSVSRNEISQLPTRNISEIQGITAGVEMIGQTRGSRTSASQVFIDGIKVSGNVNLPRMAINEVGPITGGIPGEFGDEVSDSVLNLSSGLREDFSDNAYWRPNLVTNDSGEVTFHVKFPENVTKWKSYALAMNTKKQTGTGVAFTQSYKPLMAQLATPRFLCEGDESAVVSKVSNYTNKEQNLTYSFDNGESTIISADTNVVHGMVKFFPVKAMSSDTLDLEFKIDNKKGFIDGEKRKVPIEKVGVVENAGNFFVLNGDTSILIEPVNKDLSTKIYAQSNAFPTLKLELRDIHIYPYDCMEQTASKLTALLLEQKIADHLNEPFREERKVSKLISKLVKNQNEDGSWGWWPKSKTNFWMTTYIYKALKGAEKLGYNVDLDMAERVMLWSLPELRENELLYVLNVLSEAHAVVSYDKYLKKLDPDSLNGFQVLTLMKIKQSVEDSFNIDSLLSMAHKTQFGNYYWGYSGYNWYDNSINQTLLAYQMIEKYDSTHFVLARIRNYLLELRNNRTWINTIEKAQIISVILPGILRESTLENISKTTLKLSGSFNETITEFPYEYKIEANNEALKIEKSGAAPIYFTTYQSKWNSNPDIKDSLYAIKAKMLVEGKEVKQFELGKKVTIEVKVTVEKTSEYIMIEVPIPAGCSYASKSTEGSSHEIHREYFKNKVAIFCEKLPEGEHTFFIYLLPRFSGNYALNPPKIEMMYFPIFYGRDEVRRIEINTN